MKIKVDKLKKYKSMFDIIDEYNLDFNRDNDKQEDDYFKWFLRLLDDKHITSLDKKVLEVMLFLLNKCIYLDNELTWIDLAARCW